ncbi:MAG TPA: ribose 5-phosphate isomerase B [Rhodospirillales bacterium]|jgi:ribose 5-phosphate isomerase B|nr:ribose 5-phosphate isomerase B [Rhodospirillales bacterium]HIL74371.1 ribose 5-phosphate isomerase B [Rhodospirillales bacterium]
MPQNSIKIVAIACDHGGVEMKSALVEMLSKDGYEILDLGTNQTTSVDYPDYANELSRALIDGKAFRGVLICGSGIGISIAANRFPQIRAALIHDALGAKLCREHNNANVIAFGGRTLGIETARDCLSIFLNTEFEGGRHERRVAKLLNPHST